ncbi:MAG: ABC transporter ATP-binding protein [Planctomycetes bacterium]|nr:ABC transporter ATP-binding protein [Planctomycetota bacterium]
MKRSSRQSFQEFKAKYRENRDSIEEKPQPLKAGASATDAVNGANVAVGIFKSPERRKKRRNYLREYIAWLKPYTREIIFIFALAIVSASLAMVLPFATQYAVDTILQKNRDPHGLTQFGLAMLAVTIVQMAFFIYRQWRATLLNARIVVMLRQRLYDHILHLPLSNITEMKSGGIVSRLSGDVDQLSGMLMIAVISPGIAVFKVLLTIGMLFFINSKMALAAMAIIPPLILINTVYLRRIRPIYRTMRDDRALIDGRVAETFGGIRIVRAFARERSELRDYGVGHHAVIRKHLFARVFELIVSLGWGLLIPAMSLIVIWYGGTRYLAGEVSIGGIIAFQMYLAMILQPVSAIVESYGQTQQALAAMERVFDTLWQPRDKPDKPGAIAAPRSVQSIEFDDVHFEYRSGNPVLNGVTLRVDAGQMVALVGPSGAGKTTLTNLVARFYDPTRGTIRLNGVDLRDLKLDTYRRLLGIVTQDVFLFDGTVAENIAFGRHDVTREQVESASKRANAHHFITQLPDGYETIVGERGVKLSGGQAQRVSIARAFLADPQILILDEATSNLDTESEELIQAGMADLIVDRTTFVIAHRLSTVKHADLIVVIENGRIVERGTHVELMTQDERYREMVERQMKLQASEPEAWLA